MNNRAIWRGIVDYLRPWEVAQQLRDATDMLRIAMGENCPRQPIYSGPVQIVPHDAVVSAFAPAINQPIVALYSDVNGCARAHVQHRDVSRDPMAPVRFGNVKVSAGNLRE